MRPGTGASAAQARTACASGTPSERIAAITPEQIADVELAYQAGLQPFGLRAFDHVEGQSGFAGRDRLRLQPRRRPA